ncbi:hypothetical protein OYT13_11160 [Pandoraea sp. XJJ-1]|uniref:Lipoprotein n=1 Tax=Pandoraea cepalis TaxID=2508294 RepID=A0AAW7MG85_9BURK|nr:MULTISPECIES: hypothetical protein [Pandoraea]MDN4571714.1 hypothetical protein [Pandoraea cepalis]MDN4576562.1 hypothetical protein [Pandoraea cepalis]WAL84916.1 hypothetical protein OYT13_11160 [Pandoraea sp. XJJ-1]
MKAIPLAVLLLPITLAGCTAMLPYDRRSEQAAITEAENISREDILFTSRCEFALVPNGLGTGIFYQGVCLASKNKLYLRRIDRTTGTSTTFRVYSAGQLLSASIFSGVFSDQLQLRLPQYVIALHMKRDGMQGFAWEIDSSATRKLFQILQSQGITAVPSLTRIASLPTTGTRTIYVPIPMP